MLPADPHDHPTLVSKSRHLGRVKTALPPCKASIRVYRCERSPFHRPAVEALALRPNPLELYVSSFFVTDDRVASVCEQPNDTVNTDLVDGRKLLASVPIHSPAEGWLSLDEALATLPVLQEQVIRLRSQEYLSYREIADLLGCSEADVLVAVDLALRSLGLSTKRPPRQRRRKRSNRRSRQMGVGFRVAVAS